MNFETAEKQINKDFCNLFYAKYLKGLWGIVVGYETVPDHIAIMRRDLLEWQKSSDCSNSLCVQARSQTSGTSPVIRVISYGTLASPCTVVLNPPLQPYGRSCIDRNWGNVNVNDVLVSTFVR